MDDLSKINKIGNYYNKIRERRIHDDNLNNGLLTRIYRYRPTTFGVVKHDKSGSRLVLGKRGPKT